MQRVCTGFAQRLAEWVIHAFLRPWNLWLKMQFRSVEPLEADRNLPCARLRCLDDSLAAELSYGFCTVKDVSLRASAGVVHEGERLVGCQIDRRRVGIRPGFRPELFDAKRAPDD